MKTDFDYQAVPQGFIHCFKDDCSRSDTCLRRLAARHCTADKPLITIFSPPAVPADSSCPADPDRGAPHDLHPERAFYPGRRR